MRFRKRFLATIIAPCLAALLLSSGCQSGSSAAFAYPPTRGGKDAIEVIVPNYDWQKVRLCVIGPEDVRQDKLSYEAYEFFILLPLVPWVRCDNNFWDSPTVNMRVFSDAIVRHLCDANVAQAAAHSPMKDDFRLKVILSDGGTEARATTYGLGIFPGCYVIILGAPLVYSTAKMTMEFELTSPSGITLLKKTYSDKVFYLSGEYYNWNPNTFVSTCLAKVLNQAAPDIAMAIENHINRKETK